MKYTQQSRQYNVSVLTDSPYTNQLPPDVITEMYYDYRKTDSWKCVKPSKHRVCSRKEKKAWCVRDDKGCAEGVDVLSHREKGKRATNPARNENRRRRSNCLR